MKKTIYLGLSLFAMGTFFTGCKKEMNHSSSKVIPGETIAGNLKNETFDEYVYWKDSLIINENQIDLENDSTTLIFDETSNNVYVFDNDEKVLQWANNENTEFSLSIASSLKKLVLLQKYIAKNHVEDYYNENGTTPKEYDVFFENLFGSSEKSIVNFLHDSPDAAIQGSIWAPVSYPKLSIVNFDNKTSAVSIAVSALWLFKNNWYGGSKAFFGALSATYKYIPFNNIASSVIKI